jgi:hypothetical protein
VTRWGHVALALAIAGCYSDVRLPAGGGDGGPGEDAPPLTGDATTPSCSVFVARCPPLGSGAVTIIGSINTGNDARCTILDGVCFVSGSDIDIASVVTTTGSNALAIVATHRLQIEPQGEVIAGSEPGSPGPGATAVPACAPAGGGAPGDGGPGGTFGTFGGNGGAANGAPVVAGKISTQPNQLVAGCPGGPGYDATGAAASTGGLGGGALLLVAGAQLVIDGRIEVGGEGGAGGAIQTGGGGGGAGGMIALDAPTIDAAQATLHARGGGGGGGGDGLAGGSGASGDSTSAGGTANAGGLGGAGYHGTPAGDGGSTTGSAGVTPGAGGGGGGAGYIIFHSAAMPVFSEVAANVDPVPVPYGP